MQKKETVLICPLNWGLGHATRDVPIIKQILSEGSKVIIAGSGYSLQFLKNEFPQLQSIELSGFKISYASKQFFLLWILLQLPFFGISIIKEHYQLKKIIKQYKITKVISDNRYGLWNKKIKSVLITHQVFIQLPRSVKVFEPALHWFTRRLITKFDKCWIPDYEDLNTSLSGKLSHGKNLPKNIKYIGPLSRFQNYQPHQEIVIENYPDILAIISGPEPQRTIFEKQLFERFKKSEKAVLMVCGKPSVSIIENHYKNIKKVDHLNSEELYFYLKNCKQIICRSGYSSIMDLHVLNVRAELSPTPGQTEQAYLINWLEKMDHWPLAGN
ncbi:MAG: glycosyl transferase family 28 [Salinivirgaceae bacterium]|nr:glycosyl transferase family 28 [Salinivirgaceae bacterium]